MKKRHMETVVSKDQHPNKRNWETYVLESLLAGEDKFKPIHLNSQGALERFNSARAKAQKRARYEHH